MLQVVLIENDINSRPFSAQVLACLPPLPWTLSADDLANPNRQDLRQVRVFSVDPPGMLLIVYLLVLILLLFFLSFCGYFLSVAVSIHGCTCNNDPIWFRLQGYWWCIALYTPSKWKFWSGSSYPFTLYSSLCLSGLNILEKNGIHEIFLTLWQCYKSISIKSLSEYAKNNVYFDVWICSGILWSKMQSANFGFTGYKDQRSLIELWVSYWLTPCIPYLCLHAGYMDLDLYIVLMCLVYASGVHSGVYFWLLIWSAAPEMRNDSNSSRLNDSANEFLTFFWTTFFFGLINNLQATYRRAEIFIIGDFWDISYAWWIPLDNILGHCSPKLLLPAWLS